MQVDICRAGWSFTNINLAQVPVFVGALLGAMLTYLFSSMAIKAVGRTAQMVVQDVRDAVQGESGNHGGDFEAGLWALRAAS